MPFKASKCWKKLLFLIEPFDQKVWAIFYPTFVKRFKQFFLNACALLLDCDTEPAGSEGKNNVPLWIGTIVLHYT